MGMNEMSVSVYNRDSSKARDILSRTPSEDIGVYRDFPCVMLMRVSRATFKEQKTENGLHRPYMELAGQVERLFIEEGDDRLFPCGTKNMDLRDPEDVKVLYIISTSELQDLVDMGLYYSDFQPPQGLVNNYIEIPCTITYTCVYDTPISIVEIDNKTSIETSSKDNHYDQLFVESCEVSMMRAQEFLDEYDFTMEKFSKDYFQTNKYEPIPDKENTYEDDLPEVQEEAAPEINHDEDDLIIEKFEQEVIASAQNDIVRKHEENESENSRARRKKLVEDIIKLKMQKDREERQAAQEADVFGMFDRRNDDGQTESGTGRMKYAEFKDLMSRVQNEAKLKMDKRNNEETMFQTKQDQLEAQQQVAEDDSKAKMEKDNQNAMEFQTKEDQLDAQRKVQAEKLRAMMFGQSTTDSDREEAEFQRREDQLEAQRRFLTEDTQQPEESTDKMKKQNKDLSDFQVREDQREAQAKVQADKKEAAKRTLLSFLGTPSDNSHSDTQDSGPTL